MDVETPTANDEPLWFKATFRAVDRVQALRKERYQSTPVAAETVNAAVRLLYKVAGPNAPAPAIVPTPSGSIQLEWHQRRMDIEVYVSPDLTAIAWVHDRLSGEEREEDISLDVSVLRTALETIASRT